MDTFRDATKKEHGYLLLDLHLLTPYSVSVSRSIIISDEVEISAPASQPKEAFFNRDPAGCITISSKHPNAQLAKAKVLNSAHKLLAECKAIAFGEPSSTRFLIG